MARKKAYRGKRKAKKPYKKYHKRKKLYEPYKVNPYGKFSLVCNTVKSPLPSEYFCTFTVEEEGFWTNGAGSLPINTYAIPLYPYLPYGTSVGAFTNIRAMPNYTSKIGSATAGMGWQQLIANSANTVGIYNWFTPISAELILELNPSGLSGVADYLNAVLCPHSRTSGAGVNQLVVAQMPGAVQKQVIENVRNILKIKIDLAKLHGMSRSAYMNQAPNSAGAAGAFSGTYNTLPANVGLVEVNIASSIAATAFTNNCALRSRLRIYGRCSELNNANFLA